MGICLKLPDHNMAFCIRELFQVFPMIGSNTDQEFFFLLLEDVSLYSVINCNDLLVVLCMLQRIKFY